MAPSSLGSAAGALSALTVDVRHEAQRALSSPAAESVGDARCHAALGAASGLSRKHSRPRQSLDELAAPCTAASGAYGLADFSPFARRSDEAVRTRRARAQPRTVRPIRPRSRAGQPLPCCRRRRAGCAARLDGMCAALPGGLWLSPAATVFDGAGRSRPAGWVWLPAFRRVEQPSRLRSRSRLPTPASRRRRPSRGPSLDADVEDFNARTPRPARSPAAGSRRIARLPSRRLRTSRCGCGVAGCARRRRGRRSQRLADARPPISTSSATALPPCVSGWPAGTGIPRRRSARRSGAPAHQLRAEGAARASRPRGPDRPDGRSYPLLVADGSRPRRHALVTTREPADTAWLARSPCGRAPRRTGARRRRGRRSRSRWAVRPVPRTRKAARSPPTCWARSTSWAAAAPTSPMTAGPDRRGQGGVGRAAARRGGQHLLDRARRAWVAGRRAAVPDAIGLIDGALAGYLLARHLDDGRAADYRVVFEENAQGSAASEDAALPGAGGAG